MAKILLVEDDANLGASLKDYLVREGFEVLLAPSLGIARSSFDDSVDLIILDWMLPDGQGVDLLRELRTQGYSVPIIMLTARAELIDKVLGLEAGANDYMTKPFEPRELVARARVQIRMSSGQKQDATNVDEELSHKVEVGPISINIETREVFFKGQKIEMTKMEFELLLLLMRSPNRVFSREEILNKVWGYDNYPSTRTVDTHVLQLRQKLSDELFETIRGIGYRFKFGDI